MGSRDGPAESEGEGDLPRLTDSLRMGPQMD